LQTKCWRYKNYEKWIKPVGGFMAAQQICVRGKNVAEKEEPSREAEKKGQNVVDGDSRFRFRDSVGAG